MARNFNGGTDRATFGGANLPAAISSDLLAIAARFRTTQATANAIMMHRWNNSSRSGFGFLLNNTANKLTFYGLHATGDAIVLPCTTSINDGAWRTVIVNARLASGADSEIFINGVSEGSGNSAAAWSIGQTDHLLIGDSFDAFWPTYVGDICDVGYWHGVHLDAADRAAYHGGMSPRHIKPASLKVDAPLFRDLWCRRNGAGQNVSGTTATAHPRVYA